MWQSLIWSAKCPNIIHLSIWGTSTHIIMENVTEISWTDSLAGNMSNIGASDEDDYWLLTDPLPTAARGLMTVVQTCIAVLGAVGNISMFAVILTDRTLRVWGNYLHLSLAAVHLFGCLVLSPLYQILANGGLNPGNFMIVLLSAFDFH